MKSPVTEIPSETLFAFWSDSAFPFATGGTVTKMKNDGSVETVEFGCGYWFKPRVIVPYEVGKTMKIVMKGLEKQHSESIKAVTEDFCTKLETQFPALQALWEARKK